MATIHELPIGDSTLVVGRGKCEIPHEESRGEPPSILLADHSPSPKIPHDTQSKSRSLPARPKLVFRVVCDVIPLEDQMACNLAVTNSTLIVPVPHVFEANPLPTAQTLPNAVGIQESETTPAEGDPEAFPQPQPSVSQQDLCRQKPVLASLNQANQPSDPASPDPPFHVESPVLPLLPLTPDPCEGVPGGAHEPPRPAETYKCKKTKMPSLFSDPFAQFMEDRMVQFRPSASQNNPDSSLDFLHPYQAREMQLGLIVPQNTMQPVTQTARLQLTLHNGRSCPLQLNTLANPGAVTAINDSLVYPSLEMPTHAAQDSSNSFLPRGLQPEPNGVPMMYTPGAVPFSEIKPVRPPSAHPLCLCLPWAY